MVPEAAAGMEKGSASITTEQIRRLLSCLIFKKVSPSSDNAFPRGQHIAIFSKKRIFKFSYLFFKAEKSKDVGDHWNSLQHKRHGKEMKVKNFCFQRLNYFKIWSS